MKKSPRKKSPRKKSPRKKSVQTKLKRSLRRSKLIAYRGGLLSSPMNDPKQWLLKDGYDNPYLNLAYNYGKNLDNDDKEYYWWSIKDMLKLFPEPSHKRLKGRISISGEARVDMEDKFGHRRMVLSEIRNYIKQFANPTDLEELQKMLREKFAEKEKAVRRP